MATARETVRTSAGWQGWLKQRFAAAPAKPGESYGAPGQGASALISVITVVGLLALWWLITAFGYIKPLFLPAPAAVVAQFVDVATDGFGGSTLLEHALWSLYRVFAAFLLACVTAVPIGIAMGVNRIFRGIFDPPIEFYRPIPPLAYLPLIIIWFGIGDLGKVILIYLAVFAPLALNARAGVRSVSIEQIHAAYSLGASRLQVIRHVILPAALPEILTGMRIGDRLRLDHAGRRRDGRRDRRARLHGAQRRRVPAQRRRDHGHRGDRRARLSVRPPDAQGRTQAGALEGADVASLSTASGSLETTRLRSTASLGKIADFPPRSDHSAPPGAVLWRK